MKYRKGSKTPFIQEHTLESDDWRIAQREYERLDDLKRALARKAARIIRMQGLKPGDEIPEEVKRYNEEYLAIVEKMNLIAIHHPGVVR